MPDKLKIWEPYIEFYQDKKKMTLEGVVATDEQEALRIAEQRLLMDRQVRPHLYRHIPLLPTLKVRQFPEKTISFLRFTEADQERYLFRFEATYTGGNLELRVSVRENNKCFEPVERLREIIH